MEKDIELTREQFDCLNDEDCFGIFLEDRNKAHDRFINDKHLNTTDVMEEFHHDLYNVELTDILFDSYEKIVVKADDTLWGYKGKDGILIGKALAVGFYKEAKNVIK